MKKICLLILILSCTRPLTKKIAEIDCDSCAAYKKNIRKTAEYKKDSVLIAFTVDKWIGANFGGFGQFKKKVANDLYKIHVGSIFYDSKKLKMTAFLYIEYSMGYVDTINIKFRDVKSHFFNSYTLMGYRDSLNKPWKLFELNAGFEGVMSRSLKQAEIFHESKMLNRKYLTDTAFIGVYNEADKANTIYKPIKYLPCETLFWTESPLWQKGNRVKGYYPFETYMNATPLSRKPLRDVFNINYPDSILRFYR